MIKTISGDRGTHFIKFKIVDPRASKPSRNNPDDAGVDLRCLDDIHIPPLGRTLIRTGLMVEIPKHYYGRIAPRSGLAFKNGLDVLAGVIDSSYRGELGVVLYNTDPYESIKLKGGDRIAQLIIEKHYNFEFEESNDLSETSRSNNGFGSSGLQ
jgi:dUTP pyrophosphatase